MPWENVVVGKASGVPSVALRMTTYGIIGAGNIGSQVARAAISSGYDVVISNSRGPETLTDLVGELGPRARGATAEEAAAAADFAVVAVPLKNYQQVPAEPLAAFVFFGSERGAHHAPILIPV